MNAETELRVERCEGKEKPSYRVLIADMDNGGIVFDEQVYGIVGAVVEPAEEEAFDFNVYAYGYHGRCPVNSYPWLIRALRKSIARVKEISKECRRRIRGGKYEQ